MKKINQMQWMGIIGLVSFASMVWYLEHGKVADGVYTKNHIWLGYVLTFGWLITSAVNKVAMVLKKPRFVISLASIALICFTVLYSINCVHKMDEGTSWTPHSSLIILISLTMIIWSDIYALLVCCSNYLLEKPQIEPTQS